MKLYCSNGSPFARKVRIVLAELGVPYEADILDGLRPVDSPPGPTVQIPVLEDGARRLWESDLIVDYLLRTYPSAKSAEAPPLSPWMARPEREWEDRTVLATIATLAASIVSLRLMQPEGITPASSPYMGRQRARIDQCLDWLETQVTDEGFAPGWFSVIDIAFICPVAFCEARSLMEWRGRPKLDALFDRYSTRASLLATPVNVKLPS
jgi:glutathione S-transferase